eukprot:4714798-Amphidinium_carterae.1
MVAQLKFCNDEVSNNDDKMSCPDKKSHRQSVVYHWDSVHDISMTHSQVMEGCNLELSCLHVAEVSQHATMLRVQPHGNETDPNIIALRSIPSSAIAFVIWARMALPPFPQRTV